MALALRSKTGCLKCRRRRIKCDEAKPACQRCRKGGLECLWPGPAHVNTQYLESNTTIGNMYASLFLQNEIVDFKPKPVADSIMPCPVRSISPGYPPLRNEEEHQSLIKLAMFLSMLTFNRRNNDEPGPSFEFAVALQEPWARDALLAMAFFVGGEKDTNQIWTKMSPYYTSATRAIRYYLSTDLDEARMEALLVASQFLGMIDINNPYNEIFPLLHFEAVGKLLEALHGIQKDKILPIATRRFHRIILESYLYHVSIQSLFWPQTARFATLSAVHESENPSIDVGPDANILIKLDLTVYLVLFKLTRLARLEQLSNNEITQARRLKDQIDSLEERSSRPDPQPPSLRPGPTPAEFHQWTLLATSALTILCAKVLDRSLLSTSPTMRPLVEKVLHRLDGCQPARAWTGDYAWLFTILACAVNTKDECDRLSRKLQDFSKGFWGSDLLRMKKVLELVRTKRVATVGARGQDEEVVVQNDPLNLLTGARLSLM